MLCQLLQMGSRDRFPSDFKISEFVSPWGHQGQAGSSIPTPGDAKMEGQLKLLSRKHPINPYLTFLLVWKRCLVCACNSKPVICLGVERWRWEDDQPRLRDWICTRICRCMSCHTFARLAMPNLAPPYYTARRPLNILSTAGAGT